MKHLIMLCLLITTISSSFADGDPYTKAMTEGMQLLDEAQNKADFMAAANHFVRIAEVEKVKWHPAYYASFSRAIAASMESDPNNIDGVVDIAQGYLDKAGNLDPDESEIQVLQGFIYMLRIGADPATRGQRYSGMSAAAIQKAVAISSDNPRAMYMQAQLTYGTAQFFGSDSSEACRMNEEAIARFETIEGEKPVDPFAPTWGKKFAQSFQERCAN